MISKNNKLLSVKTFLLLIYCCILLFGSAYSFKRAAYNWDILAYMVVLLSYDHVDFKTAHDKVYAIAKEQVPEKKYKIFTDTTDEYRGRVMLDANQFRQQMPYYVIKPLYTGISYLFYKAGASITKATIWPCTICYFFIGLLIFFWLQKYTSPGFAFAGGLAITFSSSVFTVAFLSSPDALSALLLLLGIFFLVEKRSLALSFIFLFLSVFARVDNIIPVIFILTAACFSNKRELGIKTITFLLLCAIICIAYFSITSNAKSFGWGPLFYTDVVKQINDTNTVHSSFILKDYIFLIKWQFMTGIFLSSLSLFLFLTLFLVWGKPLFSFIRLTLEQALSVMFILAITLRFILDPHIVERIYVPYYVSIIIFLVKKYSFLEKRLIFKTQ